MASHGQATHEDTMRCQFQPGPLGVIAAWEEGLVIGVKLNSQAANKGVRMDMALLCVNDRPYTEQLLEGCIDGSEPYTITFGKAQGTGPQLSANGTQIIVSATPRAAETPRQAVIEARSSAASTPNIEHIAVADDVAIGWRAHHAVFSNGQTTRTQAMTQAVQESSHSRSLKVRNDFPQPPAQKHNVAFRDGEIAHQDRYAMLVEGGEGPLSICGPQPGNPCQQLLALVGMQMPREVSFIDTFRYWFEQEFFPQMSDRVQQELQARTSRHGLFAGLANQVQDLCEANTRASLQDEVRTYENIKVGIERWSMLKSLQVNMQAGLWSNYFLQRQPPKYEDYLMMRTGSVNVGPVAQPCFVTFYALPGAEDSWTLSPLGVNDLDYTVLIDELDRNGGLSSLTIETSVNRFARAPEIPSIDLDGTASTCMHGRALHPRELSPRAS